MSYAVCRRAQDRAPTFRVVVHDTASIYRGIDFTLAVYAVDENGCHLNVNGTALLTLNNADASDALDDNGSALTTITITNGVWASSTVAIDGGSGPETDVNISCSATGYTDGVSDSFSLSEYGLLGSFHAQSIAGTFRDSFTADDTYLWYGGDASGSSLLRIDLSDFSTYVAYDAKTLYGLYYDTIDGLASDGTYIYLLSHVDQKIFSVLKSDMTTHYVSAAMNSAWNRGVPISDDTNVFYPTYAGSSYIRKLDAGDLTNLVSVSHSNYFLRFAYDTDYLYGVEVGTKTLKKIKKSDLSDFDSIDLSPYIATNISRNETSTIYDDGYLYVCSQDDDRIIKVKASDMSYVTNYQSAANIQDVSAIGVKGDYLYAYGAASQKVCKFNKSDLSLIWTVDVSSEADAYSDGYQSELVFDDSYLYFRSSKSTSGGSVILKIAQ